MERLPRLQSWLCPRASDLCLSISSLLSKTAQEVSLFIGLFQGLPLMLEGRTQDSARDSDVLGCDSDHHKQRFGRENIGLIHEISGDPPGL